MSAGIELDESGIQVRLGRDPKMVMELGEGEPPAPSAPPEGGAPSGDAQPIADPTIETPSSDPTSEEGEDYSNWTLEDAVKQVKEGRKEAAKYRTRAQKFESAFADLDEPTTEAMVNFVSLLKSGDPSVVPVLQGFLDELSPAEQEELKEAIEETKSMSPEEVEKLIEEREAKKDSERLAQENFTKMRTEIESLGYNLNEAEPNPETNLLFFFAGQQPKDKEPDFKEAHKKVEEFRSSVIENFKTSVRENGSRFAHVPATGATPAGPGGTKALGLKNGGSRKAMAEFLANSD